MRDLIEQLNAPPAWFSGPYGPAPSGYEKSNAPFEAKDEILNLRALLTAAAADHAELLEALQAHAEFFKSQKIIATSAERRVRFEQLELDSRALIAKHTTPETK